MTSSYASMVVTPSRSQFYEYNKVSISCEQFRPGVWTVWGYTDQRLRVSECGSDWGTLNRSTCTLNTLKESSSGVYWCESKHRDSSNVINIAVTRDSVILDIPVLPVMEGQNVTLSCEDKGRPSDTTASFFKDGSLISAEPTGQLTLHKVSKSNEGAYKCQPVNGKTSPSSWLLIEDGSKPASLTVSPDSSQLFEYDSFSLSCENISRPQEWKIKRNPNNGKQISSCGDGWGQLASSGCNILTAKPTDSAIYWCESPSKQRSNSVHITVGISKDVILKSPALPVNSGATVTLSCQTKTTPSNLSANFYKDGSLIRTEPTGHMTLLHVTTSDEGLYRCNISGRGESPSSWLFVRAAEHSDPHSSSTVTPLWTISHVAALFSFIYPTYFIICCCRHRNKAGRSPPLPARTSASRAAEEDEADYDDAMGQVTTEHQF
ncbi:PREDICTED: high affinity immunoglobulin gamma Fc receptor I-like [Cyprinodon variegatus]|uniref:high affinity immunoglobulin gamma Fc receptor I-like n=1 Tax=Cyprinodon variegatus TaxID=28743 RepID=UPI0007428A51|nr:PREDICTED: high affinity immunoglobulin gamma Fc receptor I-like [Cyprinodon variegatus]